MPELPEVEVTRRAIAPHCQQQTITDIVIRNRQLRWPVASSLPGKLRRQRILDIQRRAKYLLFIIDSGVFILHLGMSGSLRVCHKNETVKKHDHIDIMLSSNKILRFNDPRRFGSVHWTRQPVEKHRLIQHLGLEPLEQQFNAQYLYNVSRRRKVAIKKLIMNHQIVVGIGNIYASESLYLAGIHPVRAASRISQQRYEKLVMAIQAVLQAAISSGGSTLNDFIQPDGQLGYFQHHFKVYGRAGQPCEGCRRPVSRIVLGQRPTYFCQSCQH